MFFRSAAHRGASGGLGAAVHDQLDLLDGFGKPGGAAVRAEQIGKAMFEVTARASEFENGDKLGTRSSSRYSDAYDRRQTLAER